MFLQTRNCWYLALILLLSLGFASGLRINEIELNPQGDDSGNEWVELYSSQEIDLSGWRLINNKGKNVTLNFSFSGYYILTMPYRFLINDNITIGLFDANLSKIDETDLFSDSYNDNRSWQYCFSGWSFAISTKGLENFCQEENTANQTSNNQEATSSQIPGIDIILIFDNPLEYENEFEVEFKAFNLQNKYYDVKLWLEKDDKVISEIFDEDEEKWYSGNYYVNQAFKDSGNRSQDFKIRLKKDYLNFSGEVWIKARIKENNKDTVLDYKEETLKINQKIKSKNSLDVWEGAIQPNANQESSNNNPGVIRLTKDIKTREIWKSKTEYIREYSIYGFTLFCVLALVIILIIRKKKKYR